MLDIDCQPLSELKKQLIVLSKTKKNSATVIFKCINIVDRQRLDITVVKSCRDVKIRDFAHLEHKFLVPGTFYHVSDKILVQVSKGGFFDLRTAMRKNMLIFNELTIRSILYHMLSVLLYCGQFVSEPFLITVSDILVYRETNSSNPNDWTFKLKNCFIENQFTEIGDESLNTSRIPPLNTTLFADESIVLATVKIGLIIFDAIKNIYGYKSPLEFVSNIQYSASLQYVVNCLIYYRTLKSPPSLRDLLLFFQTPQELYMEKLRTALFEGVKVKKELFDEVSNCFNRSKSCFF